MRTYRGDSGWKRDNLGNTRRTFDSITGTAIPVQSDDYYPFGLVINTLITGTENYYLYNKKELQPEFNEYDYGARFYDPVIARWTKIDRYAEYCTALNPYIYVANNPIKNIDINGDEIDAQATDQIKILVDGVYVGSVTYTTTVYFEGSVAHNKNGGGVYKGNDQFISPVSNALCDLQTGDAGNNLVDDVERSSNIVTVTDAQKNRDPNNRDNFTNPDGNALQWSAYNLKGGPGKGWNDTRPGFVGLGHVLAHVWDAWNHITDGGVWFTFTDKDGNDWADKSGNPLRVYNSDEYATYKENQIRAEHGIKLRTSYSPDAYSPITNRHGNNLWFRADWLPNPSRSDVIPPASTPVLPIKP